METNLYIKKIRITECLSFIFCLFFSFLSHFLYEWTNECSLIATLVPISESVWEHAKLLFMPFFFFSFAEYLIIKDARNYVVAKCVPLIFCTPVMIMLFYTYSGVIGRHILWVDITISTFTIIIMHLFSYKYLLKKQIKKQLWLLIITVAMFILFLIFTYFAPNIPLFISYD